jgi:hypothetical protein
MDVKTFSSLCPCLKRNNTIYIPIVKNTFQGLSLQKPEKEVIEDILNQQAHDTKKLLELSDFRYIPIGLKIFYPGWEEEDCHDKYFLYKKVNRNELTDENMRTLNEHERHNFSKRSNFDLKVFNESFLDKYELVPCRIEEYDKCRYKLFKRYYTNY